jgi:non-ribosomal peptide synthase protein (TIGR01720 family)
MLVAHHLVVDAVSWRILLEDLDTAYGQVLAGEPVSLPAKSTDFGSWSARLGELAAGELVGQQAAWWLKTVPWQVPELPLDGDGLNVEDQARAVTVWLDVELSGALLGPALGAYHTRVEELVLAAVAFAVAGWCGSERLLVDVERHGRDAPVAGVDVTRTVGWFTTISPVWLDLSATGGQWGEVIVAVKEALRSVPGNGHPWMLARWLRADRLSEQLAALPRAQVSFNYLGQLNPPTGQRFRLVDQPLGPARHPDNQRPYLLDVTAAVHAGQLRIDITHASAHHPETINRLGQAIHRALRNIITHCQDPTTGGYTPSDFPQAQIGSEELSRFLDKVRDRHRK